VRRHHIAEQRTHLALHLTGAVAHIAGRGRGAGLAARALTAAAEHGRVHADLALRAEDHLAKLDIHANHRVIPALRARTRPALPAAEALPEEGLEDVAEAACATARLTAAHVVALTLARVAQHVVCVRYALETLRRLLARVHVGVQLAGEASVRLLDLVGRRVSRDSEHFVVVRHEWPPFCGCSK